MFNTENVKIDKNKKLNWTLVNNRFNVKQHFQPSEQLTGFFIWPRFGNFTQEGEMIYFQSVGQEIIDSTNVQGTRMVKDLTLRVTGASNIEEHSFFIAVCKYNKSYGGRPYPSQDIVNPDGVLYDTQWHMSGPLIKYYQSVIGFSTFHGEKNDEMIIKCQDVILDSEDSIMVIMGNLDLLGEVKKIGGVYSIDPYSSITKTYVAIAGVVTGAVAYL